MKKLLIAAIILLSFPSISSATGQLVKGASFSSIYYVAEDGKRYVFPNDKTYTSWYGDFSGIATISDAALASYQIGGNVTYRPGKKLVKVQTDPKVYAVDRNGTLRWIASEDVATALYGTDWAKQVDDVPDIFFTNYRVGAPITGVFDYVPSTVLLAASDISADKTVTEEAPEPVAPVVTPVISPTIEPITPISEPTTPTTEPAAVTPKFDKVITSHVCSISMLGMYGGDCKIPFLILGYIGGSSPWDPYSVTCREQINGSGSIGDSFDSTRTYSEEASDVGFALPDKYGVSYTCSVNLRVDYWEEMINVIGYVIPDLPEGTLGTSKPFTITVPTKDECMWKWEDAVFDADGYRLEKGKWLKVTDDQYAECMSEKAE